MNLGAHISISGGLWRALIRGKEIGCNVIQIFLRNQVRWDFPPLEESQIALFDRAWKETGIKDVIAHSSYLINLASPDEKLWKRSIDASIEEIRRCSRLGISYWIVHCGSHGGMGVRWGIRRCGSAIAKIIDEIRDTSTIILLENTAGQGSSIGSRLEEIFDLFNSVKNTKRLGVCLDTCHLFAAGYRLNHKGWDKIFKIIDSFAGFSRIKVFHLNDSKMPFNSKVDRHEHIGRGYIGIESFRLILSNERFRDTPMVIETPKEGDMDRENLKVLRGLF